NRGEAEGARGQEAPSSRRIQADEGPVRKACQDLEELMAIIEKIFGYLAAVFLAAMMLLTVADVALRTFFNRPIHGTFELIELCLACTIFVALPAVFLRDEHLVVDVVDHLARPAVVKLLDLFAAIASRGALS